MPSDQSPFDVHEVHKVAILVTASSLDCSSSIGTGSPTLQVPESSLHDTHSCFGSSHGAPTVKFAPLPQIDPNRKRSLAPLGVPGRSRRVPVIQQDGGSLLWSDEDVLEENMEDPIILLAKFLKRTSKTLWRKVRKGNKVAGSQVDVACSAEPVTVLDIRSTVRLGDLGSGGKDKRALGLEDKGRRASWSALTERRTLGQYKVQRRSTGDLPQLPVP